MTDFWNGHHTLKSEGDTLYRGEIQPLPLPDHFPTAEEAVTALFEDGYVTFPSVLSGGEVATLRARMDAMGSQNEVDYVVPGWCYNKQVVSDFSQNPDLLDYIDRPGVIEVIDAIHGGPAHLGVNPGAQVIAGSSWITGQGRAMGIHTDYQSFSVPSEIQEKCVLPIYCTTLHYYLNDMTLDLGPTILIPGSHRAGRYPTGESTWNDVAPQAAIVRAGDAVLFRNDIWHGAAKNTHPSERRYMMQVHYAHGSFGKGFPSLAWPALYHPDVLEKATPRQRHLLGERQNLPKV